MFDHFGLNFACDSGSLCYIGDETEFRDKGEEFKRFSAFADNNDRATKSTIKISLWQI